MSNAVPSRPTIVDLMKVLHAQTTEEVTWMKVDRIEEGLLAMGISSDDGSAILGATELGLVTTDPDSWHEEVFLTEEGQSWREDQQLPAIRYVYLVDNEMVTGTLADWAKVWEQGHYSSGILLSDVLKTWDNQSGFSVKVDRLGIENDWIDYRISAAGETASVRIDGRA
jgi:hypothetical protein